MTRLVESSLAGRAGEQDQRFYGVATSLAHPHTAGRSHLQGSGRDPLMSLGRPIGLRAASNFSELTCFCDVVLLHVPHLLNDFSCPTAVLCILKDLKYNASLAYIAELPSRAIPLDNCSFLKPQLWLQSHHPISKLSHSACSCS
jgi:hypothetical protein